jgi:predicted metal-dependent HD superfamily phosphohydrolase
VSGTEVTPLPIRWQRRWEEAREWLALGAIFIPVGDRLLEKYCAPGRHYHDGRHVLACLRALDNFPGKIGNSNAVELAIWFHDAVYDPRASDNEAQSAAYFRHEFGLYASGIEKVERLIMATRHGETEPESADESLIIDIDLGILGADPARYKLYAQDIRSEYAHVDEESYKNGRGNVLKSFLARKQIYQTRHYRKLLEKQARENLLQELDELEAEA